MTIATLDHRFTEFLLESNALKFGDFTLKSGVNRRISSTPARSMTVARSPRWVRSTPRRSPRRSRPGVFRTTSTRCSARLIRAFRWPYPPRSR